MTNQCWRINIKILDSGIAEKSLQLARLQCKLRDLSGRKKIVELSIS